MPQPVEGMRKRAAAIIPLVPRLRYGNMRALEVLLSDVGTEVSSPHPVLRGGVSPTVRSLTGA